MPLTSLGNTVFAYEENKLNIHLTSVVSIVSMPLKDNIQIRVYRLKLYGYHINIFCDVTWESIGLLIVFILPKCHFWPSIFPSQPEVIVLVNSAACATEILQFQNVMLVDEI